MREALCDAAYRSGSWLRACRKLIIANCMAYTERGGVCDGYGDKGVCEGYVWLYVEGSADAKGIGYLSRVCLW